MLLGCLALVTMSTEQLVTTRQEGYLQRRPVLLLGDIS